MTFQGYINSQRLARGVWSLEAQESRGIQQRSQRSRSPSQSRLGRQGSEDPPINHGECTVLGPKGGYSGNPRDRLGPP